LEGLAHVGEEHDEQQQYRVNQQAAEDDGPDREVAVADVLGCEDKPTIVRLP